MARPATTQDVEDRVERIGQLDISKFSATPALLKAYTALVEAVQKMGGEVNSDYTGSNLYIPKTEAQLKAQLESEQRTWDRYQELYLRAVKADPDDEPIKEYEKSYVKEWAGKEHKPDPFDVFAANDPELAEIRKTLGLVD